MSAPVYLVLGGTEDIISTFPTRCALEAGTASVEGILALLSPETV